MISSKDLMLNDIFYTTGFETTRIPYEVLYGFRTIKPEHKSIQNWLEAEHKINLEYVYKGKIIDVEHGHYLEGVNLYISKKTEIPNNTEQIRKELNARFMFSGIDTTEHKEWGITPEESIIFIILEDELRRSVDNFIYSKMRNKVHLFGARLEFTSYNFAQQHKETYEYRVCYENQNKLDRHNNNNVNQRIMEYFVMLISENNYMGIYNDFSPDLVFIVKG